jgi:hypothetical protein
VSFLAWVNVSSVVAGPFSTAAESGDVEEVDRLLNEGADINEGGLAPPLFYAIQNDSDAAHVLTNRGANVILDLVPVVD